LDYLAIADLKSDPTSALTLAFGGTAGPTLAIKGATTVGGVILDVSTKGKITVDSGKTLALTLGAGSKGIASGGIITAATATAGTAVKANAAMQAGTAAVIPANVGAAEVEKAASASGANLATGNASTNPASGVIGTDALVTIDTGDTFTLTDGKIVVTH
jgi:hypothetical protein